MRQTRQAGPERLEAGPAEVEWHALDAEEVLTRLRTSPDGLDRSEAARRLDAVGPNRLTRVEPVTIREVLVDQFASLVVVLLFAAAVLALLLGDTLEAAAIAAVLVLNTAIGFTVELRARRAMDALLRLEAPTAVVVRAGQPEEIPAHELVPGDVVRIEEGAAVPADARVLEASGLRVTEAALTGESIPVDKGREPVGPEAVIAERPSMLYSGTAVTQGRGAAVVVGTGTDTELGRIGALVASIEATETPLQERLDQLGRRLIGVTLAAAGVVTMLGVARGAPLGLMIETGIALAIAAVPEGLPAVATIALAVGLRRMARRNALVRRLAAVEALGSATVVCTDKTGTLTAGTMTATTVATVGRELSVTGQGYAPIGAFVAGGGEVAVQDDPWIMALLEACALTSRAALADGDQPIGDPTDAALLVLALKGGLHPEALRRARPQVGETPFTSARRWSASLHGGIDGPVTLLKGAPEALVARCDSWLSPDGPLVLAEGDRAEVARRNRELAERGLRVIGLARGEGDRSEGLTFLGLVGIVDPPAPGVKETVASLDGAGIRTVVITGDQTATAVAVSRAAGAVRPGQGALDGRALRDLDDEALQENAASVAVFSRVSPQDKLRIVSALQARGEIVAMIGDGVNDAAALKRADIGVAMGGRGTDAAKQIASIVLVDDRFQTIASAVEDGRVIYENIRKFVFYLFSCNLAEVLVVLAAGIAGMPTPLLPLQILWLNLVTDTFPALALAMEPAEPDVMKRAPRDPQEAILSGRFLSSIAGYAMLITVVTLAAYGFGIASGDRSRAITLAFMTLALAQLFHLGNARSRGPVLRPSRAFANPWAVAAVPLVIALQVLAVHWAPLARVLRTQALVASDWLLVGALSLVPAVLGQLVHLVQERRRQDA